jgi:hypothetical protein
MMGLRSRDTAPRVGPRAADRPMRCTSCRAVFPVDAWEALHLVGRIHAEEIGQFVLRWSADECVEVRRCGACGNEISARRPVGEERL